jgi:hypothetical protein
MNRVVIHSAGYIQFSTPFINCPQWQLFTGLNPPKIANKAFSGRKKSASEGSVTLGKPRAGKS